MMINTMIMLINMMIMLINMIIMLIIMMLGLKVKKDDPPIDLVLDKVGRVEVDKVCNRVLYIIS